MARGDHIRVRRFMYSHHGIDCGDGTVIHYTGTLWKRKKALITRTSLDEFVGSGKVDILKYQEDVSADEVIKRAESRLGERAYKLLINNCEHFATWCVTGKAKSKQVRRATTTVMGTLAVVGGVLVVVARKGLQRA